MPAGVYPAISTISSVPHSPQAVPSARSPIGVKTMRQAIRIPTALLPFFSSSGAALANAAPAAEISSFIAAPAAGISSSIAALPGTSVLTDSAAETPTLSQNARISTVKTTSARPKMDRCPAIMAGMETDRSYGQYIGWPAASRKRSG